MKIEEHCDRYRNQNMGDESQIENRSGDAGMVTVEVVIGLTLLIAFFVVILNYINIIYIKQTVQAALKPVAIQMSRDYTVEQAVEQSGSAQTGRKASQLLKVRESTRVMGNAPFGSTSDIAGQMDLSLKTMLAYEAGLSWSTCRDMWIVGGLDGISLAQSTVDPGTGELDAVVTYRIRILSLPFLGKGLEIPVEQHAVTRLW